VFATRLIRCHIRGKAWNSHNDCSLPRYEQADIASIIHHRRERHVAPGAGVTGPVKVRDGMPDHAQGPNDALLAYLREGGSGAIRLFIENCMSLHSTDGPDAINGWIALALPALPEHERGVLVALLIDTLLANSEIVFAGEPMTMQ